MACRAHCTLSLMRLQVDRLYAGEVGYLAASIKQVADARVGDTITLKRAQATEALAGEGTVWAVCSFGLSSEAQQPQSWGFCSGSFAIDTEGNNQLGVLKFFKKSFSREIFPSPLAGPWTQSTLSCFHTFWLPCTRLTLAHTRTWAGPMLTL